MNELDRRALLGVAGIASVAAVTGRGKAGPLNPPAGPLAPSGKVLDEIEPRVPVTAATCPGDAGSLLKITQPGSYYLTANVNGAAGKHGVLIEADNVTLDLNGFALHGVAGSLDGVHGASNGVRVRNGTVTGWGGSGIDLDGAESVIIESVTAAGCGASGISAGAGAVRCCSARGNTGNAIACLRGGTVEGCTVEAGGAAGIAVGNYGAVRGCDVRQSAVVGISLASRGLVEHCVVYAVTGDCISAGYGSVIRANACIGNNPTSATVGIRVLGIRARVEDNACTACGTGFMIASSNCSITGNTASANSTNWNVVAGNVFLAVSAATTAAAVVGSAGGVSSGTTDPRANLSI